MAAKTARTVIGILTTVLLAGLTACTLGPTRQQAAAAPIKVTEVHFDPSAEQWQASFIEIANVSAAPVDISNWQVTGAGRMTIPAGAPLRPKETVIFCKSLADVQGLTRVKLSRVVPFAGKLRNSGETIRIEDATGVVVDEVAYSSLVAVVKEASGTGKSLHRADFTARGGSDAWRAGAPSPGTVQEGVTSAGTRTANRQVIE